MLVTMMGRRMIELDQGLVKIPVIADRYVSPAYRQDGQQRPRHRNQQIDQAIGEIADFGGADRN